MILALSSIRKNIISWYPFEKESSVLEIGANFGEITGALCEKVERVVALEWEEQKREAIRKRHSQKENLEVIGDMQEIKEQFDYITIIGIENSSEHPEKLLKEVKQYLKPNGKIMMATDNKFAVKYLSRLDSKGQTVETIKNKLYSLEQILNQIKEAGFQNQKVYYPMTDYQLTNVIFTDKKPLSENNLARNIVYNSQDTIKLFEQNNLYYELLKENMPYAKMLINSFLIEIFNGEYEENEIRLVAFSNMRKKQYRIKTIMKQDFVYKYPENESAMSHIQEMKENIDIIKKSKLKTIDFYDDEKVISTYTDEKTLDKIIIQTLKEDKNKAIELMKKFKQELMEKLEESNSEENVLDRYKIPYDKAKISNMKFAKYGLWDMTFQNCFYRENEFYFYDQEWKEENLPIDFILYRAAKYFNKIRDYFTVEEVYKILGIEEENIPMLEKLDDKIQEKIRNEVFWKIQNQGKSVQDMKIQKLTDNHTINLLRMELGAKNNEIEELKKEINQIYQSKSWKITEPLRKIRKLRKE